MTVLTCPQCGGPAAATSQSCRFCKSPFFIGSLADVGRLDAPAIARYKAVYSAVDAGDPDSGRTALGLGLCLLGSKAYSLAFTQFQRAIEKLPQHADAYYYAAIATIAARPLRSLGLTEIQSIEELLAAANTFDAGRGHYDLLLGIVKHEYYLANGLRVKPPRGLDLIRSGRKRIQTEEEVAWLLDLVPVRDDNLADEIAG